MLIMSASTLLASFNRGEIGHFFDLIAFRSLEDISRFKPLHCGNMDGLTNSLSILLARLKGGSSHQPPATRRSLYAQGNI